MSKVSMNPHYLFTYCISVLLVQDLEEILILKRLGRFLGTSRTDSNCNSDICPGNICSGDICTYQEYLSCY